MCKDLRSDPFKNNLNKVLKQDFEFLETRLMTISGPGADRYGRQIM